MYYGIRNCEPVFLWALTAPEHPRIGADPSHQCSNHPNGQTVPRLTVRTVGAIGGDALMPPEEAVCGASLRSMPGGAQGRQRVSHPSLSGPEWGKGLTRTRGHATPRSGPP